MTSFSLRGSTALVALSVSLTLGAPFIAIAQDTPEIAVPEAAPPVAAAPAPQEAPWQPVTRLGLSFEVPPGIEIPETPEGLREFAVSTIGADGVGARMGMRLLDTAERESMPVPGSPEMAPFLSELSGVPLTETGVEMTLGDRRLIGYGGSGPIPASGGGTLEARMLYLIAADPDENGQALMVAVFSAGLGAEVSAELEAHFIGSLAPAGDAAAPALAAFAALPAPDGSTPEGWTRGEALGFSFAAPRTAARLDDLASDHPRLRARVRDAARGTRLVVGVHRLGPSELRQVDDTIPGTPEFSAAMVASGEAPMAAIPEPVMVGGQPMLAFSEFEDRGESVLFNLSLVTTEPDAEGNWTRFFIETSGYPRAEAEALVAQALGSLARTGAEATETTEPAATEDPTAPLLAAAEAMPLPARVTPDGWQRHSAFGLSVAAPADAVLTDRRTRRHPEISLMVQPVGSATQLQIGIATMDAEEIGQMGATPGTPGFLELIAGRAGIPTAESPRRILVGDRGMLIYIGLGTRDRAPHEGAHERSVYLVTEEPDAEGHYIFVGASARGMAPDEAETLVNQVIASIAPDLTPDLTGAEQAPPVTETVPPTEAQTQPQEAPLGFDAIAAALPDPAGSQPEGWERIEAMGVSMALPPGLTVEADPEGRGLSIGGRDEAARTEIEMGGVLAGTGRMGQFQGPPGSSDFAQGLAQWAGVEVRDSGRELRIGERAMRLYIASGAQEETPQLGASVTGYYLVSMQPDAAGDTLILGGAFRGYSESDALALIGPVVASYAPAAPADTATDTATEAPATTEETPILPDLAGIRLPEDTALAGENRNARSADLFVGAAGSPTPPHTRINAGRLMGREVERQLTRMLHRVDALTEAEIGGVPVWVIHGTATHSLEDRPADAAAEIPAQIIVPRFCEAGNPVYLLGVLTARGDEARIDATLPGLVLHRPDGVEDCPDAIMDPVRAMIGDGTETATTEPPQTPVTLPQAPEVPAGWERHVRFGLTFAAPAGMEVRRERTEPDRLEYWLQTRDAAGDVTEEISFRVFTPSALAAMPVQGPDQPGFAEMLSGFGEITVVESGERMTLGDVTLRAFRGDTNVDGRLERQLYLIAEAPSANGLSPWLAVRSTGRTSDAAQAFEQAFLASLGGSPMLPPQTQEPPPERTPQTVETPQTQTQPPAASTASPEAQAFQAARVDGSTEALLAYLAAYPRGLHSGDARAMLHARGIVPPDERRPEPARTDPETVDWQRALDEARMEAFWTYLKMWPQGQHADEARARLDHLRPAAPVPYAPTPRPMK